jgi:hypothetical protein
LTEEVNLLHYKVQINDTINVKFHLKVMGIKKNVHML